MSMYDLQAALHQLPVDHPAVLRAVVLERLKGSVTLAAVRECIADLEAIARQLEAPTADPEAEPPVAFATALQTASPAQESRDA